MSREGPEFRLFGPFGGHEVQFSRFFADSFSRPHGPDAAFHRIGMKMPYRAPTWLLVAGAIAPLSTPALAQLRETQTLVVYDSRIADSQAVKSFYVGVHPGVLTLDISTLMTASATPAGVFPAQADIDYATFKTYFRDPLRAYLTSSGLTRRVRCIVMTKGLSHRVQNIGTTPPMYATIGDNPGLINTAFNTPSGGSNYGGNLTYCSVDAELTLLWQNLDAGEAGVPGDSHADGMIDNPYWRSTQTINAYRTTNIQVAKTWLPPGGGNNGLYWLNPTDTTLSTTLTPGDIYLVCRLDGNTVADVTGMITRAQNFAIPLATARVLLDSDGTTLDGTGSPPELDSGPDYTLTKTAFSTDGRFLAANVIKDATANFTGFYVGPNVSYASATNGPPRILTQPVILLASFGANHSGVSPNNAGNGSTADTTYGTSFNFLPGAIFNSLESYNGRAFGGLGQNPFVPQQQAADVIGSGCTFSTCNAWEPLSISVADNEQLAKNFILGNMSWGEAAYTAMPALSWQQMAIGDPLARARRDREDVNNDSRVNIDDLYAWNAAPFDLNNNTIADNSDFLILEKSVRGFETAGMKADQR
jgi:hypothetical protein